MTTPQHIDPETGSITWKIGPWTVEDFQGKGDLYLKCEGEPEASVAVDFKNGDITFYNRDKDYWNDYARSLTLPLEVLALILSRRPVPQGGVG